MNFWNYKLLAKRLHEKQLSNTEAMIFLLISLAFGIFSFFIQNLIAVFLWHIKMPSFEKRLINKISLGEFLATILVLSCPSYIRQTLYALILYAISLPLIFLPLPSYQEGSHASMSLWVIMFVFVRSSFPCRHPVRYYWYL